jgi:integration host factor subunit beta
MTRGESGAVVAFVASCDRLGGTKPKEPFMTKKEIAKKISEQSGITVLLALEAVQMVFDGILETLLDEGRIELRNFGVFEVETPLPHALGVRGNRDKKVYLREQPGVPAQPLDQQVRQALTGFLPLLVF